MYFARTSSVTFPVVATKNHIGPEDTFEGDYGRLLESAHEALGHLLVSPRGVEQLSAFVVRVAA
jgi:hypothetical protein